MSLVRAIRSKFLGRLIETREGRAHLLNLMVVGEEADEVGVFDRLASLADDETVRKAVLHHKADEERHAALYRSCLARVGVTPRPVPDRLMLVRRIVGKSEDRFAAGIDAGSATGIDTRQDIMNTYAMLLVIEERAQKQFPVLGALFRKAGDAETADVFDEVANDEGRHVKYCQALGRRYAPDAATWERAVARYRHIEREAYREISLATMGDALAHDLLGFGFAGRLFGRLLCAFDDLANRADRRPSEAASVSAA